VRVAHARSALSLQPALLRRIYAPSLWKAFGHRSRRAKWLIDLISKD
jgi:hypothetical protein